MKTKFVTVQPRSKKAKNRFANFMDQLHSCKVQQEDEEKMFLESISGRYFFWLQKNNDPNWTLIKQYNYEGIMNTPEKHEKRRDALGLFVESVIKPDPQLRQCAHNQECYHELMEWRQDILDYLQSRREEEFGV